MKDYLERVCRFYVTGSNRNKLLVYDDRYGGKNGDYFTGDLLMIRRFDYGEAMETAKAKNKKVWLITLNKYAGGKVEAKISLISEG